MENIILFVKSYRGDLQRCVGLAESIEKYNKDSIPCYISVPPEDVELFKSNVSESIKIILHLQVIQFIQTTKVG